MTINLYKTFDELNVINKSITLVKSMTGNIKNVTNVTDIVVQISGIMDIINSFNYIFVSEFNRYYYITDIRILSNEICEIHGHVDVLYTYRNIINNTNVIADRNTTLYNRYLPDSRTLRYANTYCIEQEFPDGFNSLATSTHDTRLNYSYVLAVAGGD